MSAKQILVVDDEKNQRDILQLILSGERDEQGGQLYDVKTASSGQEALRAFKNENFDLVLTDLKMAGMDGIQLLNELSQAMMDASICGLGQAAPNPALTVLKYFPKEVE